MSTGTLPTDQHFQSQREVSGLGGLMQFGARFYLPKLGRFASADTIVPNFANPQSLNRYAFVLNNPLKFIDPSGHMALCDARCDEGGGAIASPTGQLTYYDVPAAQQCGSCNTPVVAEDRSQFDLAQDNSGGGTSGGGCGLCDQGGEDRQGEHQPETTAPYDATCPTSAPLSFSRCLVPPPPLGALNGGFRNPFASDAFNYISTFLDGVALGMGIVFPLISVDVCLATIVLACAPGLVSYATGQFIEGSVSTLSTFFTTLSSIAAGQTGFDSYGNLVIGQNVVVSGTFTILGWLAQDPVSDTAINGLQIGYDTGWLPQFGALAINPSP